MIKLKSNSILTRNIERQEKMVLLVIGVLKKNLISTNSAVIVSFFVEEKGVIRRHQVATGQRNGLFGWRVTSSTTKTSW